MHQVIAFSCRFWRNCNFACTKKVRCQKWKCWLWGVQETRCDEIYTTGHGKASRFQPLWSVRCAIAAFDVNQCSLRGSTFYFCLLRLGLAARELRLNISERGYTCVSWTSIQTHLLTEGGEGGCRQRKRLQVLDILKFLCGAESGAWMDNDLHCVLLLNVFGSNGNKARWFYLIKIT